MKKFLSLVLALVMTMSLVTISAGAKDFTDADDVTYVEAIDVMSAVKVIDGYTDGSFKPTTALNRGQAAKILCNMILGPTTAAALKADTAPFKDVAVDNTFAGYIAYCAKEGIIDGYTDGTFRPTAPLTGYAFMKFLLGSLGYDKDVEGYNGPNWSINVAKRALNLGLDDGLVEDFDGTKIVTREEACLFALNTMKADMVEYNAKTNISVGGAEVVIAGSAAKPVEYKDGKYDGNMYGEDKILQFAEKYFEKLSVKTVTGVYGRPSNEWKLKTESIGVYATMNPDLVYTDATKQKDVYKDMGKEVMEFVDWTYFIDGTEVVGGKPAKGSSTQWAGTDNGMVTEIYVDDDAEKVTVVSINQYIAEVTKVKTDDDGRYLTLNVANATVDDKKFYTDDFAEDDLVAVTLDVNSDDDVYVASVYALEEVSGKVTAVENGNIDADAPQAVTYIELDDEKYTYNVMSVFDVDANNTNDPELNTEYKLYLDANGYILGFEALEDVSHNYLYVKKTDSHLGDWQAKVVFADGTAKVIDLKDTYYNLSDVKTATSADLDGYVCAYSVNDKDVYTLSMISNVAGAQGIQEYTEAPTVAGQKTIENGSAWLGTAAGGPLTDKDTVFVDVKDEVIFTGYENVPDYTDADVIYVDHDGNGVLDIVFVVDYAAKSNDSTVYFYVAKTTDYKTFKENNTEYVKRTVYINGAKETLVIEALEDKTAGLDTNVGLYKVKAVNDKGYATDVAAVSLATEAEPITVGNGTFDIGVYQAVEETSPISTKYWRYNNDTVFVLVDGDKVSTGSIKDFEKSADVDFGEKYTKVSVIKADKNLAELVMIRTVKKPVPVYYAVTWNVPANTTVAVTAAGTPIASGDKVLAGTSVTITATSTDAANYNVKVDAEAAGATSRKTVSVTGDTAFVVTTEAIDHTVAVDLVFNRNARATIDGKTYSTDAEIKLNPGQEYAMTVAYAGSVGTDLQAVELNGTAVEAFSGVYYITVAAAGGTIEIGVPSYTLTLLPGISASWTLGDESGSVAVGGNGAVPEGASVTLAGETREDSQGNTAVTSLTMTGEVSLDEDDYGFYTVNLSGYTPETASVQMKVGGTTTVKLTTGTWTDSIAPSISTETNGTFKIVADSIDRADDDSYVTFTLKALTLTADSASVTFGYTSV